MDINIIVIKEAFDWFLIRACLSALVALFISIAVIRLYRFSSRLRAMAKRFGWPAVVFFLICSAWATYTAFPTQEEKHESILPLFQILQNKSGHMSAYRGARDYYASE
jgi:hypothetical protein